jgi:PAS domain S-box-containing protein
MPPENRRRDVNAERYDALLASHGSVLWEATLPRWSYKMVSGPAERILGFPAWEWLDDPEFWLHHVHPEDRAAAIDSRQLAASQGGEHQFEYRMIAASGRVVWMRDVVYAKTASGRPRLLRGVLTDITRQKREHDLHTGQMRVLETIASNAPLSGILTSIVNLIEPQSDGMLCSILLLNQDGKHVMPGAAPNLPEAYSRALDGAPIGPRAGSCGTAMFRAKQVIVSDIQEDSLWQDYRALAAQFNLRACWSTPIVSHTGSVLGSFAMYYHEPRSPGPEEIQLINVATHVAAIAIERMQAEEKLRSSEERYRRIVDTANEGIWMVDESSRITFVNRRMAEMLGYSTEEMVGRATSDFMEIEAVEKADRRLGRSRAGFRDQFDFPFRRKDGSELWGIVSTTPMHGEEGGFTGALGMVMDITGRRRAEAELQRSSNQIREMAGKLITAQEEERRRIARELHDDIVQKVAVAAIGVSRVRKTLAAADQPLGNELAGVQQSIFGLAEDIRQLSHSLHPAVLEHAGLMAALKSFTDEFAKTEGIEVKLTVPEGQTAVPRDVSVCVYRVLQEWLRNIAKHSGAKSAEVILSIAGSDLHVVVKDAGKGFNVDSARGDGLGLVSIEERIRLCRGTIENYLRNKPGHETRGAHSSSCYVGAPECTASHFSSFNS